MAWTAPSTWVAGAVVTAAQLNQQVRDNFKAIGDSGTAFTPAWTGATTNPVIGNGTLTGGYNVAGKRLWVWMRIVMGTGTTYGSGGYSIGLPGGMSLAPGRWRLNGLTRDESATSYWDVIGAWNATSSNFALLTPAVTAGNNLRSVNATAPFAFAATDEIFLSGDFELA